jgi:metal-sulfur cluster biosynthetic enzyme
MTNIVSEEEVRQTVAKVRHPEIDRTLVELGMIKDIAVRDNKVILTMVLPFLGIPIKDYLVRSVQEAVTKLGVEIVVKLAEMNQEERDVFLAVAQENWIG